MTHHLKTHPQYFQSVRLGEKTFELRKDDREPPFAVGDELCLAEYDPETRTFTGKEDWRRVAYVLRDAPHHGLMEGYAILGITP